MRCKVCARRTKEEGEHLCQYHRGAVETLRKGYSAWNYAYSGLSWDEYLDRVKTLKDTGRWIKEVIALGEVKPVD